MEEPQPKKSFRSFIWDTDTHLKSPAERKLLRKLDYSILTIGCIGFFLKWLDQGNLANAYISGMKEDLKMNGNQYTYAGTLYTVAYTLMQIPSSLIIQKIRPSYFLAVMEIGWGAFTFAQAAMKSNTELYIFRFFVGVFEAAWLPCMLFILGSWYTRTELAKRVAIFHMTSPLGTAFGGYLQAAVYKNLDGHSGIAGWRWLYIVCGCMTVPMGFLTYVFLPDTPHKTKCWFLTAAERELAIERVERAGKAPPVKMTLDTFKRIFGRWRWYGLVFGYTLFGASCQVSTGGYFGIWLKSEGFSVSMRNIIPTGTNLITAFCAVVWGFGSDYTGSRVFFLLGPLTFGLIPNGILAVWPASLKLKEAAFLTSGVQLASAIYYTWANEICAEDNEERAFVISSMNAMQYAVLAWLPIVVFPQTEAPTFRRGFPSTFGFVIASILGVLLIQYLVVRERKNPILTEGLEGENGRDSIDKKDFEVGVYKGETETS